MAEGLGFVTEQKVAEPVKKDFSTNINEVFNELANVSRRLRIIEERYINLRKNTQVTDQNMLSGFRQLNTEINAFKEEMVEMSKKINEIREDMQTILKELKMSARKEDVDIIKKYLELWNPIKFATINQVEKIAREIITQELSKRNL